MSDSTLADTNASATPLLGALKNWAEPSTKSIALLIALFYVIGLITVNAYLKQYGVSEFALLKPRFIYAGWWVAVTFIGLPLVFAYVIKIIFELFAKLSSVTGLSRNIPGWGRNVAKAVTTAAIILLGVFGFAKVFPSFVNLWPVYFVSFALATLAVVLRRATTSESTVGLVLITLLLITSMMAYAIAFGQTAYRRIPEQYGGGRPKSVQLLFNDGLEGAGKALGIPILNSVKGLSAPVTLLFDGEEMLTLSVWDPAQSEITNNTDPEIRFQRIIHLEKKSVRGYLLAGDIGKVMVKVTGCTLGVGKAHIKVLVPDSCTYADIVRTEYTVSGVRDFDLIGTRVYVSVTGVRPSHAVCDLREGLYELDANLPPLEPGRTFSVQSLPAMAGQNPSTEASVQCLTPPSP